MKTISLPAYARIRVEPLITYSGEVPEWALNLERKNPFFTFWFLQCGQLTISWRGQKRVLKPRESVLIPCSLQRRHVFVKGSQILSLSFSAQWPDGRPLLSFRSPLFADGNMAADLCKAARQSVQAIQNRKLAISGGALNPDQWLEVRSVLDRAVAFLMSWAHQQGAVWNRSETGDVRLDKVLADLAERPQAGPLPFDRWKSECGLSRVHLDRLAVQHLGETLQERRNALLMGEIRRSLAEGHESLKQLAARLGFHDAPHFTRWVKSQTGKPPSHLQKAWHSVFEVG